MLHRQFLTWQAGRPEPLAAARQNGAMCNRYEPPPSLRLVARFNRPAPERPYPAVVAPLLPGPFVLQDRIEVGQWGLIPPNSKTRTPTGGNGKRLSTNNARRETIATAYTYRWPWARGQRCLIPADSFDEPCYAADPEQKKNTWWRFRRADGEPWALAGLWSTWTDPATGEIVPSYTMLTQNCDHHPILSLMHKPERDKVTGEILPPEQQDKRSVVSIEPQDWDCWLNGSVEQAAALIRLSPPELFDHGPADPNVRVLLPR